MRRESTITSSPSTSTGTLDWPLTTRTSVRSSRGRGTSTSSTSAPTFSMPCRAAAHHGHFHLW